MKNFLRNFLGINEDMQAVANDVNLLNERSQNTALQIFEMFHALPFASGAMVLKASDAARLTLPGEVQPNTLPVLLMGIIAQARQGNSTLQVNGDMTVETREALVRRGFKVEDHEGTGGKMTFILWT